MIDQGEDAVQAANVMVFTRPRKTIRGDWLRFRRVTHALNECIRGLDISLWEVAVLS